MKAEQYAEELPALHYNRLIDDTDIQAICEMLRRLAAVEAELEAEREESKRWLVKAQNERDARKELEAELERIKAHEGSKT